jgi:hypothetical protein
MLELKLLFITELKEASCSRRGDMISGDAHCAPPRSCALPASKQAISIAPDSFRLQQL